MSPEERAESLVELVDRGGGHQSMRLRGQSNLLWHSADAGLMEKRRRETVEAIAAAIREAEKAVHDRWQRAVGNTLENAEEEARLDAEEFRRRTR